MQLVPWIVMVSLASASPVLRLGEPAPACRVQIRAQGYMPLEVGTGAVAGAGTNPVPWSFSARVHPTLAFGQSGTFRFGGVGGASYSGSDWYPLYGGRFSWRPINAPLGLFAFEVAAEAVGGVDARFPLGAAATIDIGTVLTLQVRAAPRVGDDHGFFEIGFGVHLTTLARAAFPAKDPQPPAIPSQTADPFFIEEQTIRILFDLFYTERIVDGDRRAYINCDVVRPIAAFLETEEDTPSSDIGTLTDRMTQSGLQWLANLVDGRDGILERARIKWNNSNPSGTFGLPESQRAAIVAGINWAVSEAFDSKLPST